MPRRLVARPAGALAVALVCLLSSGCERSSSATPERPVTRDDDSVPKGPLVVYSGWPESLLAPLMSRFRSDGATRDVEVEVHYGDTADLVAQLRKEGGRGPAAALLSTDLASLGALSRLGQLRELAPDVVAGVPTPLSGVAQRRDWVAVVGRAQILIYDRRALAEAALPKGLDELLDPRFRAAFALAPSDPGLQAQLAVYRVLAGEEALVRWIARARDNQPKTPATGGEVVDAVRSGEAKLGLVGHDVAWQAMQSDPQGVLALYAMPGGDGSAFLDGLGVGVVSDDPRAVALVRFLLGRAAQRYLADAVHGYPLADPSATPERLPPLAEIRLPAVDAADVAAVLPEVQRELRRAGLLRAAPVVVEPEPSTTGD